MTEGKKSPIPSDEVRNSPKIVGFRPFSSVLKNHGQKSVLEISAPDLPHGETAPLPIIDKQRDRQGYHQQDMDPDVTT